MFPYRLTPKKDTLKTQEHFYYATAIKVGSLEEEALIASLSERSKLHPVDCERLLYHLADVMGETLMEGKTVSLPNLGIFRATISSKGVAATKDFKKEFIKGLKIAFLPHKRMKAKMKATQFKQIRESGKSKL